MKKITNLLIFFAVALLAACDEPVDTTIPTLKVEPYYLEGVWQLETVNGTLLAEGTYVYLVLDRKCTFEIYQNTASMYPVLYTGEYELEDDWRVGDVISGTYDYGGGSWNHEYIITDFCKESMTWTAKDDATDVQKFVRINEVPDDIVESVRKAE